MHIYGWEFLAACHPLKNLVIIGILIAKRKNVSWKTQILYVLPLKNWVDWINTRQEKNVATSKMYILRRSAQKSKNIFLTLKRENSWAKKIVKSILETWNVNDVIAHVWFNYFWIIKLKICIVKKNNFKCTKFTIKN